MIKLASIVLALLLASCCDRRAVMCEASRAIRDRDMLLADEIGLHDAIDNASCSTLDGILHEDIDRARAYRACK